MKPSITATFLELGDATSRNLEFSHRTGVSVSYGEEAITENNLLEIRRRHSERVHVRTFPKAQEALNGADWEWRIIGRNWTAKMRVQAKRVQRNDLLKIKHIVASSGMQQRQLLIEGAEADNMKPVYCIYCTEQQRRIWRQFQETEIIKGFQAGCLLADASDIPLTTRRLEEVEDLCIPWHYLFNRAAFALIKNKFLALADGTIRSYDSTLFTLCPILHNEIGQNDRTCWNAPTIDDLNEDTERNFDRTGVERTTDEELARLRPNSAAGREIVQTDQERLRKRGIYRMMTIDVREDADLEW